MITRQGCPICENVAQQQAGPTDVAPLPWMLSFCTSCRFLYMSNPPDYATLSSSYSWEETYKEETTNRKKKYSTLEYFLKQTLADIGKVFNRVVKRDKLAALATQHMPSQGTVIDLGSDTGYNVDKLPPKVTPIGIEISQYLAERSRPRFYSRGGQVINKPALEGLESLNSECLVGAVAKSYLEHECYPKKVLLELNRTLRLGSPVIIKLPNYASWLRHFRKSRWSGYRFPDHVNYFTPKSLVKLMETCNFDIERFTFFDYMPTSHNMWCVAKKTT